MHKWILIASLSLVGLSTTLSAAPRIALGNLEFKMEISQCAVGEAHYLIDAHGDGNSLTVAANSGYTTIDIFYVSNGEDLRASASVEFINLSDGKFVYSGDAFVSNGTKQKMNLEIDHC